MSGTAGRGGGSRRGDTPGVLDGPADAEPELSGPGFGGDDEPPVEDPHVPGAVDPTTTAAGAGALGILVLASIGVITRRRARRRNEDLEE